MKSGLIFLGGTCGKNNWRKSTVKNLVEGGIDPDCLFNPVTDDWNTEFQKREDVAKRDARYNVFVLTDPMQESRAVFSIYSYIQLLMDLYDAKKKAVAVVFDTSGMDVDSQKAINKIERDLKARFGEKVVLSGLETLSDFIVEAYRQEHHFSFFLGGTCGNSNWRLRLIEFVKNRGVPRHRLFDPNVGSLEWNAAVQFLEDQAKVLVTHGVYFIGNPMEERTDWTAVSLYSNAETLMGLYDDPEKTVIVCDYASLRGHASDSLEKMYKDIRDNFPSANIFPNIGSMEKWLIQQYH